MSEQYSHRNGETESPTAGGLYWMRGPLGAEDIVNLKWDDFEMSATEDGRYEAVQAHFEVWFIGSEEYADIRKLDPRNRWWGPLVPPWEDSCAK